MLDTTEHEHNNLSLIYQISRAQRIISSDQAVSCTASIKRPVPDQAAETVVLSECIHADCFAC